MSRLAAEILSKGKGYNSQQGRPMIDFTKGGQHGWSPNLTEWISNQAYVSRPLICLLLEAPKMFRYLPDGGKMWTQSLKALFELHARSIDGLSAGLRVDTDEHAVGGGGEMQEEVVNVTRERSQPRFSFVEKYGRPIQTFIDYWIRYGLMDPETKYALLGTLVDGNSALKAEIFDKGMTADWYSATCLFIAPDPLHKHVDKAWITTNMFPKGTGDITAKRDLTSSQEVLNLDIEFSGISQVGIGVNRFAEQILRKINIQDADPFDRPEFVLPNSDLVVDSEVADGYRGYKEWADTVSKQASGLVSQPPVP